MHIRSFHIDAFGIFSDLTVSALSPGLNIFLGDNESGKSTCLDFFRCMLFGYPHHNTQEASRTPLRGAREGGSLLLETLRQGQVRLTRRPGKGGLKLSTQNGKELDPTLLDALTAGVTRTMYRNVFAFSLTELQSFKTLSEREVRDALYGATFGTGRSPAEILKEIDKRLGTIFSPQGRNPLFNKALAEQHKLAACLRAKQEEAASFDAFNREREQTEERLRSLREERESSNAERRALERRLGVWRQWEEWRRADLALARLAPVAKNFPQDGPARLERARERCEEAARRVNALGENVRRLQSDRDALVVDEELPALNVELALLAECKGSYRKALGHIPTHKAALIRAEEDLARLLSALGPDWDCNRIRTTNRSLFAREALERQAREMDTADQAHNAAAMQLQRANREVENARREFELAEAEAERLPSLAAALDEASRNRLHEILSRLEENGRRTPKLMQTLHTARSEANRRCIPLGLDADAPEDVLDRLVDARENALAQAADIQNILAAAASAKPAVEQAQRTVERIQQAIKKLRAILDRPAEPEPGGKILALRKLRRICSDLQQKINSLAELDEFLERPAPVPTKNVFLLGLGLLSILAGLGLLLARWKFNLTTLSFGSEFTFPLTLWSGYILVLVGAGFTGGGMPRSGPEMQRHAEEMQSLRSRRAHTERQVAELEEQAQRLCAAAGIAYPPSEEDIDDTLVKEREKLADVERLREEMKNLQAELAEAHEQARRLEDEHTKAEAAVQQARRRWHEYFRILYVENIPSPEGADGFFARVEAARFARNTAVGLEQELRELVEQSAALQREAADMPPVAEILNMPDGTGEIRQNDVLLAGRRVLDDCREADARAEERAKAAAGMQNARMNLARAEQTQSENADKLRETRERMESARAVWRESLAELGLGDDLSPGTVREALECMERCLNAETEGARLRDELTRLEEECDALRLPLQKLLQTLRRAPVPGSDGLPDWPASLDMLIHACREALQTAEKRKRLEAELLTAEAELKDAVNTYDKLLATAEVKNEEEFLRQAAVMEETAALTLRKLDLEDVLRLAAGNASLEEFTASFEKFDEEEHRTRLNALDARILEHEDAECKLVDTLGALNARLNALYAATGELAVLRQEEAALRETLRRLMLDFGRHALAGELINTAKHNFERRSQPAVIRAASSLFAEITDNAWVGINASLDDGSLSVLPPHTEAVPPQHLSRGAQEQLYLALRIAYIRNHASHAAALPVIMDDILVNFDPARARGTAAALVSLTKGIPPQDDRDAVPPHQILFFTCHPHQAEMLQEIVPDSLLHTVVKGKITTKTLRKKN